MCVAFKMLQLAGVLATQLSNAMSSQAARQLALGVLLSLLLGTHQSQGVPPGVLCNHTGSGGPSCICDHPKGVIDLTPLSFNNNSAK